MSRKSQRIKLQAQAIHSIVQKSKNDWDAMKLRHDFQYRERYMLIKNTLESRLGLSGMYEEALRNLVEDAKGIFDEDKDEILRVTQEMAANFSAGRGKSGGLSSVGGDNWAQC